MLHWAIHVVLGVIIASLITALRNAHQKISALRICLHGKQRAAIDQFDKRAAERFERDQRPSAGQLVPSVQSELRNIVRAQVFEK